MKYRCKIRSAMTSALQKMNLVTREEFDTQQAVLMRSREKLDALEQQIAELEETLRQLSTRNNTAGNYTGLLYKNNIQGGMLCH